MGSEAHEGVASPSAESPCKKAQPVLCTCDLAEQAHRSQGRKTLNHHTAQFPEEEMGKLRHTGMEQSRLLGCPMCLTWKKAAGHAESHRQRLPESTRTPWAASPERKRPRASWKLPAEPYLRAGGACCPHRQWAGCRSSRACWPTLCRGPLRCSGNLCSATEGSWAGFSQPGWQGAGGSAPGTCRDRKMLISLAPDVQSQETSVPWFPNNQ